MNSIKPTFIDFDSFSFSKGRNAQQWQNHYYQTQERDDKTASPLSGPLFIDYLQAFNCQIVALLNIPDIESPKDGPTCFNIDFTSIDYEVELVSIALVRDINPETGLYLIADGLDLSRVNCLHLCDSKIFNFGTN